jgi:secreted PhoX family phosphatase
LYRVTYNQRLRLNAPERPNGDVFPDAQLKIHTPGTSWPVRWITVHDTGLLDPNNPQPSPFDANLAAKNAGATPFKRPENALFLPGSGFKSFVFDSTGDTSANSGNQAALAARGAGGAIWRVDFNSDNQDGRLSIIVLGTSEQSSFDNLTFVDQKKILGSTQICLHKTHTDHDDRNAN